MLMLLLASSLTALAPPPPPAAPPVVAEGPWWASPVPRPEGSRRYVSSHLSQAIYVTTDLTAGFHGDVIEKVRVQEPKWRKAGGLENIPGWISLKYRTLPAAPSYRVGSISVRNGFLRLRSGLTRFGDPFVRESEATEDEKSGAEEVTQENRAIVREYPVGARFDELLLNLKGELFEHRTRVKSRTGWRSFISHSAPESRPRGYTGLKVTCASCHEEAGTGKYAEGLVPGGDTVLSDPLDWDVLRRYPKVRFIDRSSP